MKHPNIAFFGTPDIAVYVLEEMEKSGILPTCVITNPDAPRGRKMVLTPSPVATWAAVRGIRTLKPETLKGGEIVNELQKLGCDLFIVAAYGKIIPQTILDIPVHKTLNIHPSLLPKLRGASPIRSAILEDANPTGVSIMILTAGVDEGPILAQEVVTIPKEEWPIRGAVLDELLARKGGALLVKIIPDWIHGHITPVEQKHDEATFSKKITKDMGLIDLSGNPYENLRKIRAFDGWPGTYFFHEKNGVFIRVKIIDAHIQDGSLQIMKVIPEGKKEMSYSDFLKS